MLNLRRFGIFVPYKMRKFSQNSPSVKFLRLKCVLPEWLDASVCWSNTLLFDCDSCGYTVSVASFEPFAGREVAAFKDCLAVIF